MAGAQIGNFIIRGVDTLRLKDYTTGGVLDSIKHLKTSGLENTGEVINVTGGKGNKKIHTYTGSKASKITFTNATNNLNFLAMQTGTELIEGQKDVDVTDLLTIAANKATIKKTIKGDPLCVQLDGKTLTKTASAPSAGSYTITGQDITFASGTTGVVKVDYVTSITDTTTVAQSSESESITCSISADLLLQDVKTKKGYIGQLRAKSCKLSEDFNLNASQDGEPEAISLPFDINEVDGEPTWELVIFAN